MDKQELMEQIVEHYRRPRHRHPLPDADVTMPGGNPGCGDIVTIYLKVDPEGGVVAQASFEGEGCTISQAAADILLDVVNEERWTLEEVLETDYHLMEELIGEEAVKMRPRCATLALGTLKAAVTKYLRDRLRREAGLEVVEAENARFGIVTGDVPLENTATDH
ncbi:iron-sulfur cluster assembly scaffold protein [Thermomicrobium sp. 4228-Ro]|uniref:iron-sulfur cluster assembly scaffold protein n=1 Tax=Thermomicrobium sp. 4228-Ro TaxID=2993937 RepID=UPI00224898D5|nr:iron-sulfur cluster assembly scaffold protein [Thermomicrobium sp. 4228-Ro]MCX2726479.1 iron-sulfur cluster assembly scaffold protein [Thermomicrobium sp. 4228-Ro]